MFVRIVSFEWKADNPDDIVKIYKESVIPEVKLQKGFKSVYLLLNRDTGKGATVAFWDTKEDMLATEESGLMKKQIDRFKDYFTATAVREIYEVSAQS